MMSDKSPNNCVLMPTPWSSPALRPWELVAPRSTTSAVLHGAPELGDPEPADGPGVGGEHGERCHRKASVAIATRLLGNAMALSAIAYKSSDTPDTGWSTGWTMLRAAVSPRLVETWVIAWCPTVLVLGMMPGDTMCNPVDVCGSWDSKAVPVSAYLCSPPTPLLKACCNRQEAPVRISSASPMMTKLSQTTNFAQCGCKQVS